MYCIESIVVELYVHISTDILGKTNRFVFQNAIAQGPDPNNVLDKLLIPVSIICKSCRNLRSRATFNVIVCHFITSRYYAFSKLRFKNAEKENRAFVFDDRV